MTPFVGRVGERASLREAWAEASQGRTRLVCLLGEPGIGKTRLANELADEVRAAGGAVGCGRAWDGPGTPAWWPWTQALGAPAPRGALRDPDRFDALDAWARVVRAKARQPLLLILDDLHAADVPTTRLLTFVARTVTDRPLLLLATWRPADAALRPLLADALHAAAREARVIELPPLTDDDIEAYLRATDAASTPSRVARAARLSGGNPLFLAELAPRLDDATQVPDTIRHSVRERLTLASPPLRDLLDHAAIAGPPLEAARLSALSDQAGAEALLEEGRRLGLLGAAGFRHEVVRETLIAELPPARRAALHGRVAQSLARRADAGDRSLEIARHWLASAEPAAASPWLHQAAAAAFARGTPEGVIELLEEASPTPTVLADLAEARLRLGDVERGERGCLVALDAAREAGDAEAFAQVALAWGLRVKPGTVEATHVALLEEALERVDGTTRPGLRPRLLARLAAALQPSENPCRALELARRAVAEARTGRDTALLLDVLCTARTAYRPLDALEDRLQLDAEALALAESLGHRDAIFEVGLRLALDHLEGGDGAAARAWFRDCGRLARGRTRHELTAGWVRALEAALWGGPDQAAEALRQATRQEALRSPRDGWIDRYGLRTLLLARWLGPETIARTLAETPPLPPPLAGMVGVLHLQIGREAEAEACWRVSRSAPPVGALTVVPNAELAAHFGTLEEAKFFYHHALAMAGRVAVWSNLAACDGPVDRVLALLAERLGDAESAARFAAAAQALAARVGSPPMQALVATLCPRPAASPLDRPHLAPEGHLWRIRFGTQTLLVPDADGVRYLARLVGAPGEFIHVLDLARESRRGSGQRLDSPAAGPTLDAAARAAYRRRLRAIAAERADTHGAHLAALDREVAFIEAELTGATGLGGRDRLTGASAERARVNLTQRIKQTIDRLAEQDAALGHHLRTCIQTGTRCRYEPPPGT